MNIHMRRIYEKMFWMGTYTDRKTKKACLTILRKMGELMMVRGHLLVACCTAWRKQPQMWVWDHRTWLKFQEWSRTSHDLVRWQFFRTFESVLTQSSQTIHVGSLSDVLKWLAEKNVLSRFWKTVRGADVTSSGRLLQTLATATSNNQSVNDSNQMATE